MKKLFLLLAAVGMIFTACEAGGGDEGGNGTPTQSDKIATIEEQGANITATIATLQTTKAAVEATIASLKASEEPATRGNDNGNNGVKDMIAALEERLAALEQMIANLTGYTQGDLTEMQDWATATFATMEQYSALASELATLKALLESFEGVSIAELSDALAASEESMKQWVNEQLSGYATIADVEAQIAALTASLTEELKAEVEKVVATLTALMNETKQEYEKAITEAIQNQGIINDKIAEDIANINKRIDEELATINKRLDEIEKRLDEIEEALANLINRIQSLEYIDSNGDEPAIITTSKSGSSIVLNFRVNPRSAVDGLKQVWEKFVFVKAYYLNDFISLVNLPVMSFEGSVDTGIISVEASCDNLSKDFYAGKQDASLYLEISDGNNDLASQAIPLKAERWYNTEIPFTPANNEIYYRTMNQSLIEISDMAKFDIQSNLYDVDKGLYVLQFTSDIETIPERLFMGLSKLEEVALPNSLISIGDNAFYGCTGITHIKIPNNVVSIGDYAFAKCAGLHEVVISDNLLYIGDKAFQLCGRLDTISLGKSLKTIGNGAFSECNRLAEVVLPNTVKSIEASAFSNCSSLNSIDIPNGVTTICNSVFSNCSSLRRVAIPDSVTSIETNAFSRCSSLANVTIPQSVTSIGMDAFNGCSSLTSIVIPDSVTTIGKSAFSNCSGLTSATIGNSVTSIGDSAFSGCSSLASVTIPQSVTSIGDSAFYCCISLTSVAIPQSVTKIGNSAFSGCNNLVDISIPESVAHVGIKAFSGCSGRLTVNSRFVEQDLNLSSAWHTGAKFKELILGENITKIGSYGFSQLRDLTSVSVGSNVTSIGLNAFQDCTNITMVDIANISAWYNIDFVSAMSNPTYYAKSLHVNGVQVKDLVIPDSVTEIKKYAFYNCSAITNVVIPSTVTLIEDLSFTGCTKVALFTFKHTTPIYVSKNLFSSVENLRISIPVEACESYLYSSWPIEYIQAIVELDYMYNRSDLRLVYKTSDDVKLDGVYNAGEDVFSHTYVNGQGVIIFKGPNYMETIKARAFENCTRLISINIPRYVKAIESYAFAGTGLTEISIPDHVETIAEGSFCECANLRVVSIGNGISLISDKAFSGCSALTDLTFGNKVNCIGLSAFLNCASLLRVEIPNTVSTIKDRAFSGCVNLITTIVPASVTSLGKNAFKSCTGELLINSKVIEKDASKGSSVFTNAHFSNITIGNNITVIGKYMFHCYDQNNLKTVTIPESVTTIGTGAFMNSSIEIAYCKPASPPTGCGDMFYGKVTGRKIYVPRNSVEAYKAASGWSKYSNVIEGYDF